MHLVLVLPEVVHHLAERHLLRLGSDGTGLGKAQEVEGPVEQVANGCLVQRVQPPVEREAVDLLDGLVY